MKKSLFIASSILLAAGFTACQEDIEFNNGGVNLTQYQFKEAKDMWKGADCNVVCTYDSDTEGVQDTTMTLTLAMYQEKTPAAGVSLDLVVNTDTLNQAIQKAQTEEGNTYAIYRDARVLPSQFYTLSSSTISAGAPASVTVKRQALIGYVLQNRLSGTFVLPVSMKSSQYKVNSVLGTMMYIYQVGYNDKVYFIEEADAPEVRQVVTSDDAKNFDTQISLALPEGQRVNSEAQFDIIVDTDSLNKAIAKAYDDANFAAFRHAELLPSQYYELASNKLSDTPVKLTLKYGDLAATVKSSGKSARYVLPITIKSDSELINAEKATVMYNVTVINLEGDATKADPSAAPQTLDNGRSLVWSDEFNSTGSFDASMWVPENGFCRNNEAQWYQGENAEVKDGALVITAKKERKANPNYNSGSSDWKLNREYAEYTSASLVSNFVFNRGTLICRAKLPCKSGTWPAIWTTGWYTGWPSGAWEWPYGGEIDIMEYYPNHSTGLPSIHANVCWGTNTRWSGAWDSMNVPTDSFDELDWDYKYHVWRMDWDMQNIMLYCDGKLINQIELSKTNNGEGSWWGGDAWNAGAWRNPFTDHDWNPCYQQIFLNLALGGDNGGAIDDAATPFEYHVDYIRVYQNPDAEGGYEVNKMK
ncbi:MAG: DUF1735 domain-containing protein [Muribaculum sp.]|nr:DUF1735 domain-containing protein [Muribaculum sp.]